MRLLFYCTSLVGVGHLAASQELVRELLTRFEVDLLWSGPDFRFERHARLHALRLPEAFTDEGAFSRRERAIAGFLRGPYQGVVLEFFPFGRRRFKREVAALLDAVRSDGLPVPAFASVCDIILPRSPEEEEAIVRYVREELHTVFVRGDPRVVRFDETFARAAELGERLRYSGYVSAPVPARRPGREPRVVVSQGGGRVGQRLLLAALETAPSLPDFEFVVTAGTRATRGDLDELRARAGGRARVEAFAPNFRGLLARSRLSVSMGGENTMLDVLATRTPALALAHADNGEQALRIARLARRGCVRPLTEADLAPARLKARIEAALAAPYPRADIDLDGARRTRERIEAVLEATCLC